jgi:hypothetical protein
MLKLKFKKKLKFIIVFNIFYKLYKKKTIFIKKIDFFIIFCI